MSLLCVGCAVRLNKKTVFHLVSECKMMAQKKYKTRHDKLAEVVHWNLYKNNGFRMGDKGFKYENDRVNDSRSFGTSISRQIMLQNIGGRILLSLIRRKRDPK